jgi:acetate kinase
MRDWRSSLSSTDVLTELALLIDAMTCLHVSARAVTLQLGSGCSAAAILDGAPIDTSMGFGPLEGLVMATRCGDVDAAALTYLQRHDPALREPSNMEDLLYHRSGVLGLSGGESGDMKALLASQTPAAALAVDVFIYRLVHYIGGYSAQLGGLDALIFGGGIGEHAATIRHRVVAKLAHSMSIRLDEHANAHAAGTMMISAGSSAIGVWVVAVDEGALMARDGLMLTEANARKSQL